MAAGQSQSGSPALAGGLEGTISVREAPAYYP
jgi:hypothetical protein